MIGLRNELFRKTVRYKYVIGHRSPVMKLSNTEENFDVLLTVHLSIFILVIN